MVMTMKGHILAALREELERWEALLATLSEEQTTAPHLPSPWSTKDDIAHLRAWQQRSIARVEAALHEREPVFPHWLPGVEPDTHDNTERINAWIYEAYRQQPWPAVHETWRAGFLRFLAVSAEVSERDLLDSGRYPWLHGRPPAWLRAWRSIEPRLCSTGNWPFCVGMFRSRRTSMTWNGGAPSSS